MTEKNTPPSPKKNESVAETITVKPIPSRTEKHDSVSKKKKEKSGALYGFVTFVVLAGTVGVVWQNRDNLPPLPEIPFLTQQKQTTAKVQPQKVQTAASSSESSEDKVRFVILRNELTELRNSHEALSRTFLQLQREFAEYKGQHPVAESVTAEPEAQQSAVDETAPQVAEAPAVVPVAPVAAPIAPAELETLQTAVTSLMAKIDSMEQRYQEQTGISSARLRLLQLVEDIQAKVNAGNPFAEEFAELKELNGEDVIPRAAIYSLQQNAVQGVAPLAELLSEFEEVTRAAIPVSIESSGSRTFSDKLRSRFGSLITIRKVDVDPADESDEANIARAEAELRAGNIEMAITHLHQLTADPKALYALWIVKANNYLDTREALNSIKSLTLRTNPPAAAE